MMRCTCLGASPGESFTCKKKATDRQYVQALRENYALILENTFPVLFYVQVLKDKNSLQALENGGDQLRSMESDTSYPFSKSLEERVKCGD
jgi:hypothetical protein